MCRAILRWKIKIFVLFARLSTVIQNLLTIKFMVTSSAIDSIDSISCILHFANTFHFAREEMVCRTKKKNIRLINE
jgi:hypothetical protein